MARISTYALDAAINDADKLIGTDADNNNQTKNFSLLGIADYVIDKLIDPDATDFHIPVFNQDGVRITDSIMHQDSSVSNGTAGTQITIDGSLLVNNNATVYLNLSVAGESYLLGNVYLGDDASDAIKQRGTLELLAPIKDSSGTLGNNEQVLVSDALGKLHWENYQGTGLEYQSAWDPATNTPDLTAIPLTGDNTGKYWVASVEGDTDLGGITKWNPGDWAIVSQDNDDNVFWDKIDNSGLDGLGTTNTLAKWTSPTTLGDSIVSESGTTLNIAGNTTTTGDVKIDTLTNNYIPVNNNQGVLRDSGFFQVSAPITSDGAIGLNTTKLDSVYGEYPDFRVASRSLNDPGVLDLFRPDGAVQAGDRVGILQYSIDDDTQYAVAQIAVQTLTNSGTGDSGGGKFIFKTTRGGQTGAIPESRFELYNSADFSVPINVTSTVQSSFAGQVTIPLTPIANTDAASKGYVDLQTVGQVTGNGNVYYGAMFDGSVFGASGSRLIKSSPLSFRITDTTPGVLQPHSLAFGGNSTATGPRNSVALGYENTSSAEATLATGHQTTANNLHSASFNFQTTASGEKSAAFGNITVASGENSFAIGSMTTAATSMAFAGGKNSTANPDTGFETAFAYGDSVVSTGNNSAAFGKDTVASGERSFVAGNNNQAQGNNAVAFGGNNTAVGDLTFAVGLSNTVQQAGSIALGANNNTGFYPDVINIGTGLIGNQNNQVVLGQNNKAVNDKFVVGNGASSASRKNGLEIGPTNIKIPDYGSGTVTGTAAWNLSVDANGKIIETNTAAGTNYLSAVLLLNQSGGSAPVNANVLENSLDIPAPFNWTRVSSGEYNLNAPGKFKLLKTIVFINGGSSENNHDVAWEVIDADNLRIRTHNNDDKLTKASLEIRTYN